MRTLDVEGALKDGFFAGEIAVNMQTRDGWAYRGKVMAASINIDHDLAEFQRIGYASPVMVPTTTQWELVLRGMGDLVATPELLAEYEQRFTSLEWRCDYCGAPQERARLSCGKCGGPRSFLYELMDHAARTWRPMVR